MAKILVIHHHSSELHNHQTEFEGIEIEYQTDDSGYLHVYKITEDGFKGNATFAPGHWAAVIKSIPTKR